MLIDDRIRAWLALPPEEGLLQARTWHRDHAHEPLNEEWNTAFGPDSLFDAWTRTSIAKRVHESVRETIRTVVEQPGFRIVDVGAGDGRLWSGLLGPHHSGELVVVDPMAEAIERVANAVPDSVVVVPMVGPVQDLSLPEADAVVCSLTLHHVAGADAAARALHGLQGPGKLEVLEQFAHLLRAREGIGVLVEADVDCDLDIPSGSATLARHIYGAYIGRCARSICRDVQESSSDRMKTRWRALLRHWFVGQLAVVDAPLPARDVYELSVPRWMALLGQAGLEVTTHDAIDEVDLFQRYVFRPR